MRKIVAHLIMALEGVVKFDAVIGTIMKHRNAEEVLPDFFAKVAQEDAMLLGRVTYQEWTDYWRLRRMSHSPAISTPYRSMWCPTRWIQQPGDRGGTQCWSRVTSPARSRN